MEDRLEGIPNTYRVLLEWNVSIEDGEPNIEGAAAYIADFVLPDVIKFPAVLIFRVIDPKGNEHRVEV